MALTEKASRKHSLKNDHSKEVKFYCRWIISLFSISKSGAVYVLERQRFELFWKDYNTVQCTLYNETNLFVHPKYSIKSTEFTALSQDIPRLSLNLHVIDHSLKVTNDIHRPTFEPKHLIETPNIGSNNSRRWPNSEVRNKPWNY